MYLIMYAMRAVLRPPCASICKFVRKCHACPPLTSRAAMELLLLLHLRGIGLSVSLLLHHLQRQPAMHAYLARATFSNTRASSLSLAARRLYATEASATPKTLLFLEHRQGKLNPGSLNALTAANTLGGEVVALITGDEGGAGKAADASKK